MRFTQTAHLQTACGPTVLHLHIARSAWGRFCGLMLRPPLRQAPHPQGLLITRCPSVHGFFMRYALDIIYLAAAPQTPATGYIVTHVAHLRPWHISLGRRWRSTGPTGPTNLRSAHALELPAGSIARFGIAPGDTLEVAP